MAGNLKTPERNCNCNSKKTGPTLLRLGRKSMVFATVVIYRTEQYSLNAKSKAKQNRAIWLYHAYLSNKICLMPFTKRHDSISQYLADDQAHKVDVDVNDFCQ